MSESPRPNYARRVAGGVRDRILRHVYGDDYPAEADPRSFVTMSELRRIALELGVGRGHTFVDLGCGHGGPGLWVARETGAAMVGIDLSPAAIDLAPERAREFGLAGRATFQVGDITATGLADSSFDGAMSVDVLWSVPDKAAALRECARILKPGAQFVFTTWDRDRSPPGYPPPFANYRPPLSAAGFSVRAYEVQTGAEDRRRAIYERALAAEDELVREEGEESVRRIMFEARATLGRVDGVDYLAFSRRILVIAQRQ
jgi:SAM-dependent methyltransferase